MQMIYRSFLIVGLFLSGCSSDDVDIYEPASLVDLDNQFEIKTLWSTQIGDGTTDTTVKISPVFAYNKIFVADNSGTVAAVNPVDGSILWSIDLEVEIGGGPAVAGKMVAVGTQKGELVILDAENGELKWRKSVSSEIISSPAIGDDAVVVNSVDGKISAFELQSGEQKWIYEQSIPSLTLRGNSSPVIQSGGAISGFSNGKIAVFILENGRMAWEKTITAPIGNSEIQRLVDVDIQPLVIGQDIYVASYNGNLAKLNAQNGETIWQRELSTFQELSASELLILVTHENSFVSGINRTNGVNLWTQKALYRRQLTAPAVIDKYLVVADYEGYLHWLTRNDGALVSREQIDSDGISAAPLVVDSKIILLSHSGELYAVARK